MPGPHVVTTLREKRAELAGAVLDTKKRLARLRADRMAIEGYLRRRKDPTVEAVSAGGRMVAADSGITLAAFR